MELQIADWNGWEHKGTTYQDTAVIYDRTKGGFIKKAKPTYDGIYGVSCEVTDDIKKALHFEFSDKYSPEENALFMINNLKMKYNRDLPKEYMTFMGDELEVLKIKITRSFSYEVTDRIKTE